VGIRAATNICVNLCSSADEQFLDRIPIRARLAQKKLTGISGMNAQRGVEQCGTREKERRPAAPGDPWSEHFSVAISVAVFCAIAIAG
jgi:hypothetical protein